VVPNRTSSFVKVFGKIYLEASELNPANQMAGLGFSDVAEEASDGLEWVESNWPLGGFMFIVEYSNIYHVECMHIK